MRAFDFFGADGEVRAMVLGEYTEIHDVTDIWVFDKDDRIVAIFTPQPGESVAEHVPTPEEALV